MRYIFFALVLANVAFLAWQWYEAPEAVPSAPDTVPALELPEGVKTIRLLEEVQSSERQKQLDAVVNAPMTAGGDGTCLGIGPFQDLFSGQDVVEQLTALDIDTNLRALDRPTGENDYRVMIPPASSAENAFRLLRELKARNIDSYVITQGPEALAISLGLFSSREGAETAREARVREGYEVEISEIPRLHREYWILSATSEDLRLADEVWQQISDAHPAVKQQEVACRRSGN
ncbi:MAG: SPOR domain-containing protein [Pseudomonadales bacterium]|nr:SPOR domain-containing protein [Pseudomonadales bacterium]